MKESDLITFFATHQQETQYIEFKSSGETNAEKIFSKSLKPAICSFLNSEGGILIYGAPREDHRNSENPDNFKLRPYHPQLLGDHDSIIRKIADGITPMPIGIRLKEVEVEDGMVAVFEIQESQSKPHQTENIYQIRIDGQKKPAPHYLIEAMMKQVTFPTIKAYLKTKRSEYCDLKSDTLLISFDLSFINFSPFQNEKNIRYRLKVDGSMILELGSSKGENLSKETDYFKIENLTYGEPYTVPFTLSGNFGMIQSDKKVLLNIIFHGESSPSKLTVYEFYIEQRNLRGFLKGGKAILDIDNILISEHKKNLGLTHEESLKKSLGIDF
ncbi:AlbA family DNA-binding domain-containing protein [Algoriphagus faecimaris]|uniref:AlbA family DNA-binding domain-containing protein n=1 Tax=Algoriphagus faecimaris TaxID=686796 RepID=UPI00146EDC01|nr:ATP-binding protein [Algoriphagus faecimaris]